MLNEALLDTASYTAMLELLVTFMFGCIAAWFSWLAYRHSKEKFRLELLNKRWPIYQLISDVALDVHGLNISHLNNKSEDYEAIHMRRNDGLNRCSEKLKTINLHELQVLFGKDVKRSFYEMFKSISGCTAHKSDYRTESVVKFQNTQMQRLLDEIERLPAIFAPYMDFSEYSKTTPSNCCLMVCKTCQHT